MESEEARSLEEEILKVVSSEKLEELIREKGEQFHGLLTREAALFAISKEMKVAAPEKPISLSELTVASKRSTVIARLNRIFETKSFEKNGKQGRVCRVFVGDGKSERPLVLWNEDVDYIEKGRIAAGDLLELRGVYLKNDELHLGYGGRIEVSEKKPEKKIANLSAGEFADMNVSVAEPPSTRRYERDGASHEMSSCPVSDGETGARLILWEPNVHSLDGARQGDSVRLEGVRFRDGELHAGKGAFVKLIRKPIKPGELTSEFQGELEGKITGIETSKEGITVQMEGGGDAGILFRPPISLRFLGLKSLPEDIAIGTLAKLKGPGLVGSTVKVFGKSEPREGRILFIVEKILS